MKGSLVEMTGGIVGEALLVCDALAGVTSFHGVGVSAEMRADSPTLSAWALSSTDIGLGGEMGASTRAPCAVVEIEGMASATMSVETSPLVG